MDALFKRLIEELPAEIDRGDFVRQMISRMPDYFAMSQAEKENNVE